MQRNTRNQWLVVLFGFGCLLFSFPLLELFNRATVWFGLPLIVLYLFCAWFIVIGLLFFVHERFR